MLFLRKSTMSFPRQRPRNITPEAIKEWNDSKLEWYAAHRPVHTWPWSILKEYQTKNNILTTGARELQNWRVERFLHGEPAALSPVKRGIFYSDAYPEFTVFPYKTSYEQGSDQSGLLRVHRDTFVSKILLHLRLYPQAVFSLMLTCKDMQAVCQRYLVQLAQERFGPLGTPKALLCAALYEEKLPEEFSKKRKKRAKRALFGEPSLPPPLAGEAMGANESLPPPEAGEGTTYFKKDLKAELCLTARDFKANNVHSTDVQTIIEIAIKKYGCIDNLPRVRALQERQVKARQDEKTFVQQSVAARLAQVNAYLTSVGYKGLRVQMISNDNNTIQFTDARVLLIIGTFENSDYHAQHFLGCIRDWVNMQVERSVDSVCMPAVAMVPPLLFNTAMSSMSSAAPYHPLQPYVVRALIDVRHRNYMFYDRVITEQEWLERLAYVFSDHFRQRHKPEDMRPGNHSYVCCWRRERPDVHIYHLHPQINSTPQQYSVWMKLIEQRFYLRLATPATGIPYAGIVPGYYVSGDRQVNFAHCLLTKKK